MNIKIFNQLQMDHIRKQDHLHKKINIIIILYHNSNNIIKIFMGIIIIKIIKKQAHIIILKETQHRQVQGIHIRILIIIK